jgi:hypothetical protein
MTIDEQITRHTNSTKPANTIKAVGSSAARHVAVIGNTLLEFGSRRRSHHIGRIREIAPFGNCKRYPLGMFVEKKLPAQNGELARR